jgi:hypothetical protein
MRGGGPKSAEGKAAVALNASRHGLRSPAPVVTEWETELGWRAHCEGVAASLAPEGVLEEELTQRIASLLWRLRRVEVFETESMLMDLAEAERRWRIAEEERIGMAAIPLYGSGFKVQPDKEAWLRKDQAERLIPKSDVLERVLRYEAHLQRQLVQTMHELEALQIRRNGEGVAPLARVDVG